MFLQECFEVRQVLVFRHVRFGEPEDIRSTCHALVAGNTFEFEDLKENQVRESLKSHHGRWDQKPLMGAGQAVRKPREYEETAREFPEESV